MASVKGSKHYQMRVVPHRPHYKVLIYIGFGLVLVGTSWFTYDVGRDQGLALRVEAAEQSASLADQLEVANRSIDRLQAKIAELQIGGEIDHRANEEVRDAIEALQEQIAQQNEEISFYKGVMLPNVGDKGLRIERLDMSSNAPGKVKYSVLLTQVVDKHDFITGDVDISVHGSVQGQAGEIETSYALKDLDEGKEDDVRFRFRYFQNINGELTLPDGFEPREVTVVAHLSGSKGQRLERSFDWPLQGG